MEEINHKESDTTEDIPQPPIKTYQWEDIRRARTKGGYPWTHLTKPPFDEEIDVEMFTMDAFRRSRSSSTLEPSEKLHIEEITDEVKTDTPKDSKLGGSEVINDTESSMDVDKSQFLKNEPSVAVKEAVSTETTKDSDDNKENLLAPPKPINQGIRAFSEEPSKKRKLSIESSHSRISLSKLALKDKLKDVKEKLKLPKLIKRSKSDVQETKKPKVQKTEIKGLYQQVVREPVYIHIPLKPPPGETDEYSKYEFESPGPASHSGSLTQLPHSGSGKRKLSLLGLLTELKKVHDRQVLASESNQGPPKDGKDDKGSRRIRLTDTSGSQTSLEKLKIEEITDAIVNNEDEINVEEATDKSVQEIKNIVSDVVAAAPDDNSLGSNISQYLDKDEKYDIITTEIPNLDIDCVIITEYNEPPAEVTTEKNNLNVSPKWTRLTPDKDTLRPVRAKSEEPKRKRKSSIDSSYSRKSLSKLAFMKKIKDTKDTIKLPKFLSFSKADKKSPKPAPSKENVTSEPKKVDIKKTQRKEPAVPVYIHIPLKLPEGQTDEFSHLAEMDVEIKQEVTTKTPLEEEPESETPITPDTPVNDIQLIILTPPSDDEILDSNAPETPSESDQKFFETLKVDELKSIAKRAVDIVYPDHKTLEAVVEDYKSEEASQQGVVTEGDTTYWQMHPVLVDVEDGLKLSDAAIAMINEEMSKEIELGKQEPRPEITPQIKKKVSFKKSRAQDGERIYEDVGLVSETTNAPTETFRSMSADEEKSYLDEKVIKTTSLDEDYNKWSKITDHEYEPVNPPPENMKLPDSIEIRSNIAVNHQPEEQLKQTSFSHEPDIDEITENFEETPTAQELQDEIEGRYFNAPKPILPKPDNKLQQQENTTRLTPSPKAETKRKDKPTKKKSTGNNFNIAFRTQADKLKTKLQGIKRPNINIPPPPKFSTPKFSKLNFKKPTFTVPKMPEMPSINFASFSLTRKDSSKNSWRKRQYSTESNAGDSKTKKFDFRTYPRIFDKSKTVKQKSLDDNFESTAPAPSSIFATVPRVGREKALQKPEIEYVEDEEDEQPKEYYYDKSRGLVTIPIDPENDNALHIPSHIRYNEDINIDDGYNDDQNEADVRQIPPNIKASLTKWHEADANKTKAHLNLHVNGNGDEIPSDRSSGSLSEHRQGVLEEIDSDQFFLREKGISQDDIDVGKYLSSEIKEAFRNPINALTQLQSEDREYDVDVTDQSQSSEEIPKRKWMKKPKRKKTPHVSKEQLSFECGSDPEDYMLKHNEELRAATPTRPKRRSKKSKKKKMALEDVVPYQETIPFEQSPNEPFEFIDDQDLSPYELEEDNEPIQIHSNTFDEEFKGPLYMNTPDEETNVSPEYINTRHNFEIIPTRPIRKNKSVKSLNAVEFDSNVHHDVVEKSINSFEVSSLAETTERQSVPPVRPNRKRSHTRSASVISLQEQDTAVPDLPPTRPLRLRSRTRSQSTPSLQDNEIVAAPEPPARPTRTRSRTRSQSKESFQDKGSLDLDSPLKNTINNPCLEEPCIQVICDRMGYAVVDRNKARDPPLPPSRFPKTPPRTRRKRTPVKDMEDGKFATVPRAPSRPIRNYSTLGNPKSTSRGSVNIFEDDKENIDLNQYIEIEEDELARRLQSGEVIQKMRERPLPAPPRPPRKARTPSREVFRDISHERNLPSDNEESYTKQRESSEAQLFELEQQILTDDHEETITHAALVVQPINKSTILSHSEFFNSQKSLSDPSSAERIILIEQEGAVTNPADNLQHSTNNEPTHESGIDEEQQFEQADVATENEHVEEEEEEDKTSEIPEEFYKFKEPYIQEEIVREHEEGNLKLQQLDIDMLRVNELTANKIIVSELEGGHLQVSEINSKAGNLVISGLELPPNVIQGMLDQLRRSSQEQQGFNEPCAIAANQTTEAKPEQFKKQDSAIAVDEVEPPPVPPRSDSIGNLVDIAIIDGETQCDLEPKLHDSLEKSVVELPVEESVILKNEFEQVDISSNIVNEPPARPPRKFSQVERLAKDAVEQIQDKYEETEKSIVNIIDVNEQAAIQTPLKTSNIMEQVRSNERSSSDLEITSSDSLGKPADLALSNAFNSQLSSEHETQYVPSQPPPSFYNLRSTLQDDFNENNIPLMQCRMCRHKFATLSRSSSSEELSPKQPRPRRLSESSIPQLTGQLVQSCAVEIDRSLRNLITSVADSVLRNAEGKQDLQVMLLMLLILIATLILISGDGRVSEHHHHWEYFNPPREL